MKYQLMVLLASTCLALTITVDAQARDRSQCVPIAVTAFSPEEIEEANISDLLSNLPLVKNRNGTQIGFNPGSSRVAIRGAESIGGDTSPLYVVDGQLIRNNGFTFNNGQLGPGDIDRIEILKGPSAAAIYGSAGADGVVIISTKKHERGAFATEVGNTLQNPAIGFEYDLNGSSYGASGEVCIEGGRILPYSLTFGIAGYDLDGSDRVTDLNFAEGFGITGVGGDPGVFVGQPTNLQTSNFRVERDGTEFSVGLGIPLFMSVHGGSSSDGQENVPNLFDLPSQPSVGVTSILFGLRGGSLNQDEETRFNAFTPAFGQNANWNGEYSTKFDGKYLGASMGVGYNHTFFSRNGTATTFSLSGTVGYDQYDFDVDEQVSGMGLGGALNYFNNEKYDFNEALASATLKAGVDWRRGNLTLGAFASYSTGVVPEIDRFLPDSDLVGALDPKYSLSNGSSANFGLYGALNY